VGTVSYSMSCSNIEITLSVLQCNTCSRKIAVPNDSIEWRNSFYCSQCVSLHCTCSVATICVIEVFIMCLVSEICPEFCEELGN
jgi:hypothetical protein